MVDPATWLAIAQIVIDWLVIPGFKHKRQKNETVRAFAESLSLAHIQFSKRYPELASSLLDETFLKRQDVSKELSKLLTPNEEPDIEILNSSWKSQFFLEPQANVYEGIQYFIEVLNIEIVNRPELNALTSQRGIYQSTKGIQQVSNDVSSIIENHFPNLYAYMTPIAVRDFIPEPPEVYVLRENVIKNVRQSFEATSWVYLEGRPGMGKTQVARDLYLRMDDKCWISLKYTENPRLHVFQQLILHSHSQFASISNLSLAELLTSLEMRTEREMLVVIDDLPNPVQNREIYLELANVFGALTKLKLLTTSQYDLPNLIMLDSKEDPLVISIQALEINEIEDLLRQVSAPENFHIESTVRLLHGYTLGHPGLCQAVIHWLKEHAWKVDLLGAILDDVPAKDYLSQKRRQLFDLLNDPISQRFLYRLSLINDDFEETLAIQISTVNPQIFAAKDRLENLVGPWVEQVFEGRFAVTQLLRNAWEGNLVAEEKKELHEVIVQSYLKGNTIDITKSLNIASHISQTGNVSRLAEFIVGILRGAKTPTHFEQVRWAIRALGSDTDIYHQLTIYNKLMLRSQQIRGAEALGLDTSELFQDLLEVLNPKSESILSELAILYFVGDLSLEKLPVDIAADCIKYAILHAELNDLFTNEEEYDQYSLIWVLLGTIYDISYVVPIFRQILTLPHHIVERLYENELALEVTIYLIDMFWIRRDEQKKAETEWSNVLEQIDELAGIMSNYEPLPLAIALKRAKSVIYGNYLEQLPQMIQTMENPPHGDTADLTFIEHYTFGTLLHDNHKFSEALGYFQKIEQNTGTTFEYYRFTVPRYIAVCWANSGDLNAGKVHFITIIRNLKNSPDYFYEYLNILGEIALIYVKQGNPTKAFYLFKYAIENLISRNALGLAEFRETTRKYIVILTQINAIYLTPLHHLKDNPIAGFFAHTQLRLQHDDLLTTAYRISLMIGLAIFAQISGLIEEALDIVNKLNDDISEEDYNYLLSLQGLESAGIETYYSNFDQALETGLGYIRILHSGDVINQNDEMLTRSEFDQLYNRLSVEEQVSYELHVVESLAVILFAKACHDIPAKQVFHEDVKLFSNALKVNQNRFADYSRVQKLMDDFETIFYHAEQNENNLFSDEARHLKAAWMLARSKFSKIEQSLILQVNAMTYFVQTSVGVIFFHLIADWLYEFWLDVAHNQGFRLNSPQMFRSKLETTFNSNPRIRIAMILDAASTAFGLTIPDDFTIRQILQAKDKWR